MYFQKHQRQSREVDVAHRNNREIKTEFIGGKRLHDQLHQHVFKGSILI
jgi:hypothetical protein